MSHALNGTTAIVTVSYNSSNQLNAFIDSLNEAGDDIDAVVIADNASRDVDITKRIALANGARVLCLESNRGYGGAINRAVKTLSPQITSILICNPDVLMSRGSINGLKETLDRDPRIACVGPRIVDGDGTTYPSARRIPSLRIGIGHALFVGVWPGNPWTRMYHADKVVAARDVDWLSGACLLVRRDAFDTVGGFDEGYFMYFEDVDLGYRLGKAGFRNRYEPSVTVTHFGGLSTASVSKKMIVAHHLSAYRFLAKKYHSPFLFPLRVVLRIGLTARAWLLTHKK